MVSDACFNSIVEFALEGEGRPRGFNVRGVEHETCEGTCGMVDPIETPDTWMHWMRKSEATV